MLPPIPPITVPTGPNIEPIIAPAFAPTSPPPPAPAASRPIFFNEVRVSVLSSINKLNSL